MSADRDIPGLAPVKADPLTPAGERILETASRLFYWYGIRAVGVEKIAKQAGINKKTIFDRFGSKDTLIAAHLRRRDTLWRARIREAIGDINSDDPKQILLAPFDALDAWVHDENPRGCSMINAYAELVDPDHPGRQVILEHKQWLRQFFVTVAKEAGSSCSEQLSDQLLILYDGAVVVYSMRLTEAPIATARMLAKKVIDSQLKTSLNNS